MAKRKCEHGMLIVTRTETMNTGADLRCMNRKCDFEFRSNLLLLEEIGAIYSNQDGDELRSENASMLSHFDGMMPITGYNYELELVKNPPLRFFADGLPGPQGSKKHMGNGRMAEMSKKVGPWRMAVTARAREAGNITRFDIRANKEVPAWNLVSDGAVRIDIVYWMPAPKTSTRLFPSVTPDIDKLTRATYDGITLAGNIIHDDGQIVAGTMLERYALPGMPIGADIIISCLE